MSKDNEKMNSGCIFELNEPDKDVNVQAMERICGNCCYYEPNSYYSGTKGWCTYRKVFVTVWLTGYNDSGCRHWNK